MINVISKQASKLQELETLFKASVYQAANYLGEISQLELYLETHGDWNSYCKEVFGFTGSHGYQLIKNAKIVDQVSTIVDTCTAKMLKGGHLREIAKVPEKLQASVVSQVLEQCETENRKPTARDFKQAAKPFIEEKQASSEGLETKDETPPSWQSKVREVDAIRTSVNSLMKQIRDAPDESGFEMVRELRNRISIDLSNAKSAVVGCIPYKTCPYCMGADTECSGCSGRGWVNKPDFNNAPKEMQDEIERLSSGGSQ